MYKSGINKIIYLFHDISFRTKIILIHQIKIKKPAGQQLLSEQLKLIVNLLVLKSFKQSIRLLTNLSIKIFCTITKVFYAKNAIIV